MESGDVNNEEKMEQIYEETIEIFECFVEAQLERDRERNIIVPGTPGLPPEDLPHTPENKDDVSWQIGKKLASIADTLVEDELSKSLIQEIVQLVNVGPDDSSAFDEFSEIAKKVIVGGITWEIVATLFYFGYCIARDRLTRGIQHFLSQLLKWIVDLFKKFGIFTWILHNGGWILFCTLNTHKIDMDRLLGSHIGLDDFIFVHVKGQKKEVDLCKTEESLGLTITDNGAGRAFIKRIRQSSQISKLGIGLIDIGDHIEKIDDESFVGRRHYDIATKLRSIPIGKKFSLRLISPEKSDIYYNLSKRSDYAGPIKPNVVHGKKTIRINANNVYEEETPNSMDDLAIDTIGRHIERALGISDNDLAQTILDIGKRVKNPADFNEQMNGELGEFEFPSSLIYDFWGVITDAKAGILTSFNDETSTTNTILSTDTYVSADNYYEDRL